MTDDIDHMEASVSYAIVSVSKNLAILLRLYALLPYLADRIYWQAWILTPFIGLIIYRLTMVMHDCGHGTLFVSRRANMLVGKFLGFFGGCRLFSV